jgi:quinolinate synthase
VVTYVNTTAAVKAEADICCTSANAVQVVESLGTDRVILLPDEYLAHYVASQTEVEIIAWPGRCEVHERFTPTDIEPFRRQFPRLQVIAHPECSPAVLADADYVGSTAGMIAHVAEVRPEHVMLVTECSMSDNVAAEYPMIHFVRPCNLCPHMKRITLANILRSLETMEHQVEIEPRIAERARLAVERMLAVPVRVAA